MSQDLYKREVLHRLLFTAKKGKLPSLPGAGRTTWGLPRRAELDYKFKLNMKEKLAPSAPAGTEGWKVCEDLLEAGRISRPFERNYWKEFESLAN